jgi:general secretion pathway protein A
LASRSGSAIRDAVIAARDGTPDPATARSVAPPAALVATAAEPRAVMASAAPAARAASSSAAPRIASLSDERSAWQELARLWNLPPTLEDPCKAANARQVQCFKGTTSLAMLRVLDRPAILTLLDSAERPAYALLTGLTDKSATLHMGASGVSQTVSLVSLSRMWHGEFATMWRSPPGYPGLLSQGASGPAVQHLATQLAAAQGKPPPTGLLAFDATVKSQVDAFQQSHGLKPDGVAGPTTFMLLNRATGVDEPRLAPGA